MSNLKENMEVVREFIEHKVTTLFEGDRETNKKSWRACERYSSDLKKFLTGPVQLLTITNTTKEFQIKAGKAREDSEFPTLTLLKHEPKSLEMFVAHMRKTEVWDSVSDLIDWNLRPGNALKQMDASFKYLFVPLFEGGHMTSGGSSGEVDSKKSDGSSSSYEFTNQVQKFSSQLSQVVQHVTEKVDIEVPDVDFSSMEEKDAVKLLEPLVHSWTNTLQTILERETMKRGAPGGPIQEVLYWRERHSVLSPLYHQLNKPKIRTVLQLMYKVQFEGVSTLKSLIADIIKYHTEAKDNVKFLATLERHFNNLSRGTMSQIREVIPAVVNAIRMIWIISKHYNTDDRVVPLMERIAGQLTEKVMEKINVKTLFRGNLEDAKKTISEAQCMLEDWKRTYMEVRAKIEKATDNRWEFSKKILFEKTDYVAKRCGDLHSISSALDEFRNFLGPQLKAIVSEPHRVDKLANTVTSLVEPMENMEFDVFDLKEQVRWETMMVNFQTGVKKIEDRTNAFIDDSFSRLRTALGAFELLQNFKNIRTRDSIRKKMMQKFDNILNEYSRELNDIQELFEAKRDHPPITKGMPPVAGSIRWAVRIFERAKEPIMKFQTLPGLLQRQRGEAVKAQYVRIAREIDEYAHQLYHKWTSKLSDVSESLKGSVLGPPMTSESIPSPPYSVNFPKKLEETMKEATELSRLGFQVPDTALNIALQKGKFVDYCERLQLMLDSYHDLANDLTPVEKDLLSEKMKMVQMQLRHGFSHLNWNSLHINHFIEHVNKAIGSFNSLRAQVKSQSDQIDTIVRTLESASLIPTNELRTRKSPMVMSEISELLEMEVTGNLEKLRKGYLGISDLLLKVEELVASTSTKKSKHLKGLYEYWEKRVYNALVKTILRALVEFGTVLNLNPQNSSGHDGASKRGLCVVSAIMHGSQIAASPAPSDMKKVIDRCMSTLVETSKSFPRWLHETCIVTTKNMVIADENSDKNDDDDLWIPTFFDDISKHPIVIRMIGIIQGKMNESLETMESHLESWKKLESDIMLCNSKHNETMLKQLQNCTDLFTFDSCMSRYSNLISSLKTRKKREMIDFYELDLTMVASELTSKAGQLVLQICEVMRARAKVDLKKQRELFAHIRHETAKPCNDFAALMHVLKKIDEAMSMEMNTFLENKRIMNDYELMKEYMTIVKMSDDFMEEYEQASKLQKEYAELKVKFMTRDLRMNKTKAQFRQKTLDDVNAFKQKCEKIGKEFEESGPASSSTRSVEEGLEMMERYRDLLKELRDEKDEIAIAQKVFQLPTVSYPQLFNMESEMNRVQDIYNIYVEHKEFVETMSKTSWAQLDIVVLNKGIGKTVTLLKKMPRAKKQTTQFKAVNEIVESFRKSIPLIQSLKNDAMQPRHWQELMKVTGVKFNANSTTFTLQSIFDMGLSKFSEEIAEVVNVATQEMKIQKNLQEIEEVWRKESFDLIAYNKTTQSGKVDFRGMILKPAEETKLTLEDNMMTLQAMSSSQFVGEFLNQIQSLEKKLNHVADCIDVWFKTQSKWMYLECIFIGNDDICQQLPKEAKFFKSIDQKWKGIMKKVESVPNVMTACSEEGILNTLEGMSANLDRCQKGLSDYLDTKKNAFPRFFFISDDELLAVLGSSDPTSLQQHVIKLVQHCKRLKFERGNRVVAGMISPKGESFEYKNKIATTPIVEQWMTDVENEMYSSLKEICKEGVFSYASTDRIKWIEQKLGQVTILGSQIWWTWEVEDVFRKVLKGDKHAMKDFSKKLNGQLADMIDKIRDSKLPKKSRRKINTLLIIDVHARNIVESFIRDSILDVREFEWESQLRFYWDRDEDDVVIRQCTGKFCYGYEFMGLDSRLVITPLTDRCYMTITQALTFKLGCSPAGPAGTGKTETVKDLAKGMGLPCYVTCCGEGLDYRAMGSIFSGLCQIGAWGCFDEFNRINIEVISVVSAQLRALSTALIAGKNSVTLISGNPSIKLKPQVGVFITMNPGYAGRTELPDSIKALFRRVTMIRPDLLQICEIWLYSEGFDGAMVLANKMTKLYGLAESQLSKQYHYDFSLRTLKSVLVTAGDLKRKYSHMSEDLVLMRALRDQNLPRFVFDDVPLFLDLLQDLFPGLDCPRVGFPELKASVAEYFEEKFMHHSDEAVFETQVNKSIQIYETLGTRHTIIVVGPTGGGKTTVTEALASGMKVDPINRNVKIHVINPKAQNVSELYGNLNQATREWTDGILSNKFRSINEPLPASRSNEMRWLIFDGDVDAVWIEDMNSVMDDNKTLTLPNSERIQLQDYTKLFVEVFDLQYASPATISRCGVVYVDPKDIGYRPFFERWIKTRPDCCEEDQAFLMTLLEKYIVPVADFIFDGVSLDGTIGKRLPRVMEITSMSSIRQFCSMFDSVTKKKSDDTMKKEKDKGPQKSDRKFLEANFMYCTFWAYGSLLSSNDQLKLDEIIGELTTLQMPHGSLFDYFYDDNTKAWVKWEDVVPKYEQPNPFRFAKVLVPTTSSVIYTRILDLCYEANKPALFVGESGTAKTVTIQNFLNTLDKKSNIQLGINFSSRTNGNDVYVNLNNCVDKRTSNIYGPQSGMTLNMFVDDMSMPKIDLYGTQQPAAFLLLLLSRGCYYSKEKDLDLRLIRDVKYFGAMAPPGGGRNSIDPRFAACFNVFNLNTPSETVLRSIYSSIITTFVNSGTFSGPVKKAAEKITNISLRLFFHLLEKLPPTPAKFHYIFNLRDLGRVFEGLCRMTPDKFTTKKHIVRLFVNECSRVFSDRLISEQDQTIFFSKLSDLVKSDFSSISNDVLKKPLLYGSFGNCIARLEDGVEDLCLYDDMGDHDSVAKIFENVLELYNIENELKQMNLVLFSSAVEHLVRLHRVLTTPLGNALLVGVGGSGKQSVTHLASFCAGYHVFTITLSRGYGENEFREELKELFRIAYKKPVTFLFTDAHCVEEGFLELINNILTVGMVPALFRDEDKDAVVRLVTPAVKEAGLMPTELNCMNHFKNVCRNNIHVVLAMTPSGTTLFNRCRAFPGLVSASVIDWFFPWPKEALLKVVSHFMEDLSLKEEYRHPIAEHFVMVHSDVVRRAKQYEEEERRFYCVTPKNYLDFISNYKTITAKTLESVEKSVARLGGGLEKLAEAEKSIAKMQIELEKAQKIVSDKAQECEVMIADITEKSEKTEKSQKAARVMEKDLEEKSKVIESEKSKADKALEEAIPALEAAAEALENLDKADITEIRGFANPPEAVKKVSLCVLHLKPLPGKFTEDWKGCKTMLSNMKFLDSLKEYNKDHMKDSQVRKVQKYMKDPEFTPEAVAVKSKAGGGLLTWVYALVKYHGVAKNVAPLRAKVKQMTKEKEESEEQLDKIQTKLSELQAEIDELSQKYESKSSELTKLKNELDEMNNRLTTAKNLIAGLSSEQKRWTKQKEDLVEKRNHIPGDCLLAASFLSYLGAFTLQYREMMMEDWMLDIVENRNVPLTKDYSLRNILTTDAEIQQWIGEGLPGDKHSIQNGILTSTALRFPLCIDPQQQAVKWIKNKEGDALVVRTFNSSDFVRRLQLAVQYGKPFLFEDVMEDLDPVINPILDRLTYEENNTLMVNLADSDIPWDAGFQLYMTSKLSNPRYSPEVMGRTMVINYAVTITGLQNQLLNVVVANERPDLEEKNMKNIMEISNCTRQIFKLEEKLLFNLRNSKGDILEDTVLLKTLDETKKQSVQITSTLDQAKFTANEINTMRQQYVPAAKRGSIAFFAAQGLSTISKMYELSLASYLVVFNVALRKSTKSLDLSLRLKNIIEEVTRRVYNYVCMGLFERHKLMFAFQLTTMIMDGNDELNRDELSFFIKGDTSLGDPKEKRPFSWITKPGWKDLTKISSVCPKLKDLIDDIKSNEKEWKDWYDLECPELAELPCGYSKLVTRFQKLLVVRCFRQDRSFNSTRDFVEWKMGKEYVEPPVLNYDVVFEQSTAYTPIVFVLSPGADPQGDIMMLADRHGFSGNKFKYLALGQGQGPEAEAFMKLGKTKGYWILLQNCHLLLSWLGYVEGFLQDLETNEPHEDFRLWLTTDPSDKFPLGIIQRALKVVTEPPDGLKLNMMNVWANVSQEMLDECAHEAFQPLVFSLSFLHAVVLERRKYGKIGWNVQYDFSISDFTISRRLMSLYLNKAYENGDEQIPWNSLKFLVGDAMYGGRVSDDFDRRVLQTYMNEYFGDFVFDTFQEFCFSNTTFKYTIPKVEDDGTPGGTVKKYRSSLEKLPLNNSPSVFGLHPNAEISYFTQRINRMWRDLIELQPRSSSSGDGAASSEDITDNVAQEILKILPEVYDIPMIRKGIAEVNPISTVLFQELDGFNKLLDYMIVSLHEVRQALKGEIGMSETLEQISSGLFNGFLPSQWARLAPKTEKPLGPWMKHLARRIEQYNAWIAEGQPKVIWLSGLNIPESYNAALVQMTCRAKNWPLDKSTLYTSVSIFKDASEVETAMQFGTYACGLYLEGAGWDHSRQCLKPQDPKSLVTELPVMQIIPIEARKLKLKNTFRTPVYVTQSRRNAMGVGLVFEANLKSAVHPSLWTLQGVALVLNIDT